MLKPIKSKNVRLLPSIFKERYDLNRSYLMNLKNQGLLQNFYLEAGIILPGLQVLHNPDTDEIHWGWDAPTCQLRGHFLGHWLSAAASIFAADHDYELKAKLDKIIDELIRCQELNGGEWIGPIPEKYFQKLEKSQHVWSPQYVMHKLLLGLMNSYIDAGNEKALVIFDKLSDWYIDWTDDMLQKNPHAIYAGEEAGMLEVWITMYEINGQEKYLELAKKYSNPRVFRDLEAGKDTLTNCHANASIPWSHGAARLYEVTGEEKWRKITEAFWKNAVTDRGYYCTGGQGAGEYWTPPFQLGHFLSDANQEFCTVYNMIRTASYLYKWTGDTSFADYIELNLYNGFLAQQNRNTGMPTYFLPLKAGSKKKWGTPTRDFWCCHGTMVQAQTLYSSLIYFEDENRLIVSQYIPSELKWSCHNTDISIVQSINMKYYNNVAFFDERDESQMSRWSLKFQVTARQNERFTLSFRVPKWVKEPPVVTINNEKMNDILVNKGYINITREWLKDEILIYFPCRLEICPLPDLPDTFAFMEGPVVLAGICDEDRKLYGDADKLNELLVPQYEHTYGSFPWKQGFYKTKEQPGNINFMPLYEITDENYTVYFHCGKRQKLD
jgi:DUF1680 family protein